MVDLDIEASAPERSGASAEAAVLNASFPTASGSARQIARKRPIGASAMAPLRRVLRSFFTFLDSCIICPYTTTIFPSTEISPFVLSQQALWILARTCKFFPRVNTSTEACSSGRQSGAIAVAIVPGSDIPDLIMKSADVANSVHGPYGDTSKCTAEGADYDSVDNTCFNHHLFCPARASYQQRKDQKSDNGKGGGGSGGHPAVKVFAFVLPQATHVRIRDIARCLSTIRLKVVQRGALD